MATLLLRLAGPMQSWGIDSKFETRRTEKEPSKSGVVGLLASALGRRRDENVEDLAKLKMGVRIDRPGVMIRDFHMVHNDEMDTRSGPKYHQKYRFSTLTYRNYLSDAVFLVGLESTDLGFLKELDEALHCPVFPLFLGRRSCPATLPISLGIRDCDMETSLRTEKRLADGEADMRIVLDGTMEGLNPRRQRDVPKSFSPFYRQYGFRTVNDNYICDKRGNLPSNTTEHDAMEELR